MKCLLRYPGGKSRMLNFLRPHLLKLIENETTYGEPFIGGGSVALCVASLDSKIQLAINDKDTLVSGMWQTISGSKDEIESLIERLNVQPTVEMWDEVKALQAKDHVDRAFKAVFLNRTSYNGMIHGSSPIGGRKQTGKPGADRVWKIDCQYHPDQLGLLIRQYHELLSGRTTVTSCDGVEFMQARQTTPHFVDPPYFIEDKPSKSLYGVLMSRKEHAALSEQLKECRKWILTYDLTNEIAKKLYRHMDKRVIDVKYSSTTRHTSKWKEDSEFIALKGL